MRPSSIKADAAVGAAPAQPITSKITALGGWRGEVLALLRKLIHEADPDITEEWKWGSAAWTHQGLVCSAGAFSDHAKLNFTREPSISAKATTLVRPY